MSTYDAHAHYASDRETTHAGASCELCGDDADFIRDMKGGFSMPVCTNCDHDKITSCESCGEYILMHSGVRPYNSSSIYCIGCAKDTPEYMAGLSREAIADEFRDDFNRTRR